MENIMTENLEHAIIFQDLTCLYECELNLLKIERDLFRNMQFISVERYLERLNDVKKIKNRYDVKKILEFYNETYSELYKLKELEKEEIDAYISRIVEMRVELRTIIQNITIKINQNNENFRKNSLRDCHKCLHCRVCSMYAFNKNHKHFFKNYKIQVFAEMCDNYE
jgi:hypothetical protein